MAQTAGLVQRLTVVPGLTSAESMACVWIGPTPNNTEVFLIRRDTSDSAHLGAFKNSMVDALTSALVDRREVVAFHAEADAEITSLTINPA